MAFLNPLALAGLALMIPVLLLYMLRLRHREVTVSSTMLWQQVLRDREANTPWQRLRRNLLLFLQLLILLLLVLALARPVLFVPAVSAGRVALLLDASASMQARDGDPGTRFEQAVRAARDILATAGAGDEFSVIQVSDTADVLAPFTSDRAALARALDAAAPGQGGANWETAFTLAAAGAPGSASLTTVVLSDGGGALQGSDVLAALDLPGEVRYVPVGARADNLAVTALAVRALPGQPPQLFAQAQQFGPQASSAIFDLRIDGDLVVAEQIEVDAGGTVPFVAEGLPEGFRAVRAGLTAPSGVDWPDLLPLDNAGYAVAEESQARRVLLVSEGGNRFLEQALGSLPGVELLTARPSEALAADDFDLVVLDSWVPAALPQTDLLLFNPPESTALFTVGTVLERGADGSPGPTGGIRTVAADPRLRYVDLSEMNLLRFRSVSAAWAEPLITAEGGPLLLAGETGGRQVAVVTFDVRDSDLPLTIAFPILMASLVEWFAPQQLIAGDTAYGVGDSVTLRPAPGADAVRVTPPEGEPVVLPLDTSGEAVFMGASMPGLYTVEALAGEEVAEEAQFAVNLFDPAESDLTPRPEITVGGETVQPQPGDAVGQRELWPWLALAGLALLLVEWLIWLRRQRVPTRFHPVGGVAAR